MSLASIRNAWTCNLPPAQLIVLINLAYHANTDDRSWPSLKTIADECHLARRTVQRSLDALEATGYITVVKDARQHAARTYRVQPSRGGLTPPLDREPGATSTTSRGDILAPEATFTTPEATSTTSRGGLTPPKPLRTNKEPKEEPSENGSAQVGFDELAIRRTPSRFADVPLDAIYAELDGEALAR